MGISRHPLASPPSSVQAGSQAGSNAPRSNNRGRRTPMRADRWHSRLLQKAPLGPDRPCRETSTLGMDRNSQIARLNIGDDPKSVRPETSAYAAHRRILTGIGRSYDLHGVGADQQRLPSLPETPVRMPPGLWYKLTPVSPTGSEANVRGLADGAINPQPPTSRRMCLLP
jgi:hypothetical protein